MLIIMKDKNYYVRLCLSNVKWIDSYVYFAESKIMLIFVVATVGIFLMSFIVMLLIYTLWKHLRHREGKLCYTYSILLKTNYTFERLSGTYLDGHELPHVLQYFSS